MLDTDTNLDEDLTQEVIKLLEYYECYVDRVVLTEHWRKGATKITKLVASLEDKFPAAFSPACRSAYLGHVQALLQLAEDYARERARVRAWARQKSRRGGRNKVLSPFSWTDDASKATEVGTSVILPAEGKPAPDDAAGAAVETPESDPSAECVDRSGACANGCRCKWPSFARSTSAKRPRVRAKEKSAQRRPQAAATDAGPDTVLGEPAAEEQSAPPPLDPAEAPAVPELLGVEPQGAVIGTVEQPVAMDAAAPADRPSLAVDAEAAVMPLAGEAVDSVQTPAPAAAEPAAPAAPEVAPPVEAAAEPVADVVVSGDAASSVVVVEPQAPPLDLLEEGETATGGKRPLPASSRRARVVRPASRTRLDMSPEPTESIVGCDAIVADCVQEEAVVVITAPQDAPA